MSQLTYSDLELFILLIILSRDDRYLFPNKNASGGLNSRSDYRENVDGFYLLKLNNVFFCFLWGISFFRLFERAEMKIDLFNLIHREAQTSEFDF